ncbi:hypothetical protein TRIUR3_07627 [Triticum urartu]|uniref:Uncharacterized protein n=1 Tax=Triticum urartu TaxID=4572 RepID=M7YNT6_TRIUA|nr:hypothetical protein TRIUR3_07627 [Triticum urartu]
MARLRAVPASREIASSVSHDVRVHHQQGGSGDAAKDTTAPPMDALDEETTTVADGEPPMDALDKETQPVADEEPSVVGAEGRKFSAGRLLPPTGGTGPMPRRPGTGWRSRLRRWRSRRIARPHTPRRLALG